QFIDLVERGQVAELTVSGSTKVSGKVRNPDDPSIKKLELNDGKFSAVLPKIDNTNKFIEDIITKDLAANRDAITKGAEPIRVITEEAKGQWVTPVVYFLLPMVLLIIFFTVMFPRLRDPSATYTAGFIRSTARRVDKAMNRTTFSDVAGMENSKRELGKIVEFLKNPEKLQRLGAPGAQGRRLGWRP